MASSSRLTVIIGRPGTGKTRLAQQAASSARRAGTAVLVSDPYRDPRWGTPYLFADPLELNRIALAVDEQGRPRTVRCLVVTDEAGAGDSRWRQASAALARGHRHHGHAVLVLVHRWSDVPPVVRSAASRVIALPQGAASAIELAREYGIPELEEAGRLPLGSGLLADLSGEATCSRLRLW